MIPLFVGKGQSNMVGTALMPNSQQPTPGATMLKPDGNWGDMIEPSSVWGGSGYGPATSFMRRLMQIKGWPNAAFINVAVNGSLASSWIPGAVNFENAWEKINAALQTGEYYLAGVVAVDGESETNSVAWADSYEASVWAFYYGLCWRVGNPQLPMIITKLGQKPLDGTRPAWNAVRDHQQYVFDQPGRPANIKIASAWGIERETVKYLHYVDAAAYDELGIRLASQIASVV